MVFVTRLIQPVSAGGDVELVTVTNNVKRTQFFDCYGNEIPYLGSAQVPKGTVVLYYSPSSEIITVQSGDAEDFGTPHGIAGLIPGYLVNSDVVFA